MANSNSESESSHKNKDNKDNDNKNERDTMSECNICFDNPHDPVVSFCGHLFCWPCLHQWLETTRSHPVCPVCKVDINKNKVIPIYGRSNFKPEDPRNKVPPRPSGRGTEPGSTSVPRPSGRGTEPGSASGTPRSNNNEFYIALRVGSFPYDNPFYDQIEDELEPELHADSANFITKLFACVLMICLVGLSLA